MTNLITSAKNDSTIKTRLTKNNFFKFLTLTLLISLPIYLFAPISKNLIPEGLPINHLGFLIFIAPITAALLLTYKQKGFQYAKALLKESVDLKNIKVRWYLPIIVLLPAASIASMGVMILSGVQFPTISLPIILVPVLMVLFFIFGICEEVGWQGYAFKKLEKRWSIFKVGIVLGLVGAFWHLPLFLIQNPPGGLVWIIGQCINLVLLRLLIVGIFSGSGRSIFSAVIFHAIYNLCTMVLPIYSSPLGPHVFNIMLIPTILILVYSVNRQFKYNRARTISNYEIIRKKNNSKVTI